MAGAAISLTEAGRDARTEFKVYFMMSCSS
jgi:hypothetical protein